MASILDTVRSYLPENLLISTAGAVGEDVSAVKTALGALAPMLLAGMANKAETPQGLSALFGALSGGKTDGFLGMLPNLIGTGNRAHGDPKDAAGHLVGMVFGERMSTLLPALSQFANFKSPAAASALLGLAGPLVMGVLGAKIKEGGLDASGLKSLLLGEKAAFHSAVPPALGGALGLTAASTAPIAGPVSAMPKGGWIGPLVALGAFVATLWALVHVGTTQTGSVMVATDSHSGLTTPAPAEFNRTLAGVPLKGAMGGIEQKLLGFIEANKEPCKEKECWFSFDRLTFATGSAALDMEKSADQLTNIVTILNAFPSVKLKIGGYTDNVGSDAVNTKLSDERANTVMGELVAKGIDPTRLAAEGFGAQFPVASNDTEEGRAANRRIDVRVTAR